MADAASLRDGLKTLDSLAVDVLTDNVSDTYVSKTLFAVSEFANVIRGGADRHLRRDSALRPISAMACG